LRAAVGVQAHERLEDGGGQLQREGNQAHLAEIKMEGVLEERIDRGISDCSVSFKRWQKLMVRRILKTVFSPVSPGAAARIAVKFVSLAI